jgi:hypothetical protein
MPSNRARISKGPRNAQNSSIPTFEQSAIYSHRSLGKKVLVLSHPLAQPLAHLSVSTRFFHAPFHDHPISPESNPARRLGVADLGVRWPRQGSPHPSLIAVPSAEAEVASRAGASASCSDSTSTTAARRARRRGGYGSSPWHRDRAPPPITTSIETRQGLRQSFRTR